jgi:hypothetical protein
MSINILEIAIKSGVKSIILLTILQNTAQRKVKINLSNDLDIICKVKAILTL